MEFAKEQIFRLVESMSQGKDIKAAEIPDIDLYMDQVTTFIDSKLEHLKRNPKDKLLTKTMINNYSKFKLLLPSKNKKYNKQHMMLLVLIYYLKQIVSIGDISTLFAPLFKEMAADSREGELEKLYSIFLESKRSDADELRCFLDRKLQLIDEKAGLFNDQGRDTYKMLLLVLTLVAQANEQKRLAEKIIDEYFEANPK